MSAINALNTVVVIAAPSSTDNALPRFDGTIGNAIQNSLAIIDDLGNLTLPTAAHITIPGNSFVAARAFEGSSIQFNGSSGNNTITLQSGLPNALQVTDGVATNGYLTIDTTNQLVDLNVQTNFSNNIEFISHQYTTGTIAVSGITVTGSGTTFLSKMSGGWLVPSSGLPFVFAFNSATTGTSSISQSIGAGATFILYYFDNQTIGTDFPALFFDRTGSARQILIGGQVSNIVTPGGFAARASLSIDSLVPSIITSSGQTASQSLTTITGVGTTFTSSMVGRLIYYATGQRTMITGFTSTTSLTASTSINVPACQFYISPATSCSFDGVGNAGVGTLYQQNAPHFPDGSTFNVTGPNSVAMATTGSTSVTLPTSGTLATTSQIPALPLTVANGGTGVATLTAHGVLLGEGSSNVAATTAGSSGQLLQSGGASADPAWTTATYPTSTTAQQILYSTATSVIGQLTTANSSLAATNSSGTLAMRALSVVIQTFTASGTYTPTTGMLYCIVELVGSGGGGGGTAATGATTFAVAAGGGGGEYGIGVFSASTIGASQTVTIGAAGTAGAAGNNAGGAGNTTSLGSLLTAAGGSGGAGGGAFAGATNKGPAGGTGGTGVSFHTPGGAGGTGFCNLTANIIVGGAGGTSRYSEGTQNAVVETGIAATGKGGGGGGASQGANGGTLAGAAGTAGFVVVTEFVIN